MNKNQFRYSKYHPNVKDISGHRFGSLDVVRCAGTNKRRLMEWWCLCDCGMGYLVQGSSLRSKLTTRCILCTWKAIGQKKIRHGAVESTEYNSWRAMMGRTTDPRSWNYSRYGGAGIVPCAGFKNATWFLRCMGPKPTNRHSLDRIRNQEGYNCGQCDECKRLSRVSNCRWATPIQQARNQTKNKYIEFRGRRLCVAEWAALTGISPACLFTRIGMGWSAEKALTTPVRKTTRSLRVSAVRQKASP